MMEILPYDQHFTTEVRQAMLTSLLEANLFTWFLSENVTPFFVQTELNSLRVGLDSLADKDMEVPDVADTAGTIECLRVLTNAALSMVKDPEKRDAIEKRALQSALSVFPRTQIARGNVTKREQFSERLTAFEERLMLLGVRGQQP